MHQMLDNARAERSCAIGSLAVCTGLQLRVLGSMTSKQRGKLLQVHITMVQCGTQQHLAPVFSSCTTSAQLVALVADVERFLAVLGDPDNEQLFVRTVSAICSGCSS
jgi:cobyrinic acid a,c-diamide synthase